MRTRDSACAQTPEAERYGFGRGRACLHAAARQRGQPSLAPWSQRALHWNVLGCAPTRMGAAARNVSLRAGIRADMHGQGAAGSALGHEHSMLQAPKPPHRDAGMRTYIRCNTVRDRGGALQGPWRVPTASCGSANEVDLLNPLLGLLKGARGHDCTQSARQSRSGDDSARVTRVLPQQSPRCTSTITNPCPYQT